MAFHSAAKEWTLVQGLLVSGAIALGAGAFFLGRFDPAAYLRVEAPPPQTPLMLYGQMRGAVERGDWPSALAIAQAVEKALPGDAEAERVRSTALLQLRRFAEAETALKAQIARRPDDIAARLGLAAARSGLGEAEAAEQTLRAVLAHPAASFDQREEARRQLFAAEFVQDAIAGAPRRSRARIEIPTGLPPWMRPSRPIDRKALGLPPAKK